MAGPGKNQRRLQRRRARLFNEQYGLCYYCRTGMVMVPGFDNSCTVDHYVPLSMVWGRLRPNNHVAACFACNQAKGDMTGIAFILLRKRREEEDA